MSSEHTPEIRDIAVDEEEINLLELLNTLVRRRRTIIKICALAIILSIIYSLRLPNIYSAKATLLPPQKESGGGGVAALLGQMGGLAGLAGGIGLGGSADLYMGILKSRSVADGVIKRLDLLKEFKAKNAEEARNTLAGAVKFQSGKDGIIVITADSKKPEMAAKLANAYVEELERRSVELNLSKAGTERVFLEKRLDVVGQELKKAENDLKSFQERYKAIKVDAQATATFEGIARLKAEMASKEVQLATLRSFQTDESPEVKALQVAINKLRSQVAVLAGRGESDGVISVGSVPNLGLEYARLLREVKIQEAVFEQLTKQYEVAKLSEAKDSSTIQVLDEAVVPVRKSKPKRSLIVILSAVTAFFVGIFTVFVQEYFSKMPVDDRRLWSETVGMLTTWRRK